MKIKILVKIIPDVENFTYDYDRNVLVRENVSMLINPEDACALAYALKMKEKNPECFIEIVTMAPLGVKPIIEDLLRRHVDQATLISDKLYVGSDSYVTSKILGRYLASDDFDCILTGTHALDGDTSHVPAQLGELLQIGQMSNIIRIEEATFGSERVVIEVEGEQAISKYEMTLPAILSVAKESKYKLPFVKYKDLNLDVSQQLKIITNEALGFRPEEVGFEGSLTKVARTYVKKLDKRTKMVVQNDAAGIDFVYAYLKEKGYVGNE